MTPKGGIASGRLGTVAGAALLLAATTLAAAAPPPADAGATASEDDQDQTAADETITVTGQREKKADIRRESRSFSGTVINLIGGQFSRRVAPVCPAVLGIASHYQTIVINKIKDIALRAGAGFADGGCKKNLYILFSTDIDKTFKRIRQDIPITFNEVPLDQRKQLHNGMAPARWWYRSEIRDADGMLLPVVRGNDPQPIDTSASLAGETLINSSYQINLAGSVVVIDLKRAEGYPLEAVAAHAAMVSLVQIKLGKSFAGVSSVLNIYAPGRTAADAPLDLTRWDYAFIRSLYEIRPRLTGSRQKAELAFRMADKLSGE